MKFSFQTEILIRKLEEVLCKKNFVWKAITLFIRYMKSLANPRESKSIHLKYIALNTIRKNLTFNLKQWAEMISFKCCFYGCNVFNITDWTLISSHEQSIKGPIKTHCDYSLRRMFMTLPFVFYLLNVLEQMRIYSLLWANITTKNKCSNNTVYHQVQIHVIQP